MSDTSAGFWDDAEVISCYTRAQAIDDGVLVDVSEWGSAETGFLGGFKCPVAMTRALWDVVDVDAWEPASRRPIHQDTRGRAHDVLWMASLALRVGLARKPPRPDRSFDLLLSNGRARKAKLRAVIDGDGVTIGFPEDF